MDLLNISPLKSTIAIPLIVACTQTSLQERAHGVGPNDPVYQGLRKAILAGSLQDARDIVSDDEWDVVQTGDTNTAEDEWTLPPSAEEISIREKLGESINLQDEEGETLLSLAIQKRHPGLVKLLLDNGADITIADKKDGFLPIHLAASMGSAPILRLLLLKRATVYGEEDNGSLPFQRLFKERKTNSINLQDDVGLAPLHYAAEEGAVEAITFLLQQKQLQRGITDNSNQLPVHKAAKEGHEAALKLLLNDSNKEALDENGQTPLGLAILHEQPSTVRYLIKDAKAAVRFPQTTALHLAASSDSLDVLKHCYDDTLKNSENKHKETPLFIAAKKGCADAVTYLLDKGCDHKIASKLGQPPLHIAAKRGHLDVVKAFHKHFGDDFVALINTSTDGTKAGMTPLYLAASMGKTATVKWLLAHGARLDITSGDSPAFPIHVAAQTGRKDVVAAFIAYGQDKNIQTARGCTPLHSAIIGNQPHMVDYLLDEAKVDTRLTTTREEEIPLLTAARHGYLDIAKKLLQHDPELLNAKDRLNNSALHLCAVSGNVQLFEWLHKEKGLPLNEVSKEDYLPFHLAIENGRLDIIKFLHQETTQDINQISIRSGAAYTPCITAAASGRLDVLNWLIDQGVDARKPSHEIKLLPIHGAVVRGQQHVVERLLALHPADLEVTDGRGVTPLGYALEYDQKALAKWLLEEKKANANVKTVKKVPLLYAQAQEGKLDFVKLLVENGANKNEQESDKQKTALYTAVQCKHKEVAKFLLEQGADANLAAAEGWTPLHIAAAGGDVEIATLLLDHDALLTNRHVPSGYQPIHSAARAGCTEVVSLFLGRGATGKEKTKAGLTPLQVAKNFGKTGVVTRLTTL